jgi:hypothetical protein
MVTKRAKPAAADGGSRQCIGSGQNLTADSTECRNIAQQATLLSLDSIVIGERHRKDMGDIAGSRGQHCRAGPAASHRRPALTAA